MHRKVYINGISCHVKNMLFVLPGNIKKFAVIFGNVQIIRDHDRLYDRNKQLRNTGACGL